MSKTLQNVNFWQDLTAILFIDDLNQFEIANFKHDSLRMANFIFQDLGLKRIEDNVLNITNGHLIYILETLQSLYKHEHDTKIANIKDDQKSIIKKIVSILIRLPKYACYLKDLQEYLKLFKVGQISNHLLNKIHTFTDNNECLTTIAKLKYLIRKDDTDNFTLDANIFDFETETKVEKFTHILETSYYNLTQQELRNILHVALSRHGKYDSWSSKQFRTFQNTLHSANKRDIIFILRQHFEKEHFQSKFNESNTELENKTRDLQRLLVKSAQDAKEHKVLSTRIIDLEQQLNEQKTNCQKELKIQMSRNNILSQSNQKIKDELNLAKNTQANKFAVASTSAQVYAAEVKRQKDTISQMKQDLDQSVIDLKVAQDRDQARIDELNVQIAEGNISGKRITDLEAELKQLNLVYAQKDVEIQTNITHIKTLESQIVALKSNISESKIEFKKQNDDFDDTKNKYDQIIQKLEQKINNEKGVTIAASNMQAQITTIQDALNAKEKELTQSHEESKKQILVNTQLTSDKMASDIEVTKLNAQMQNIQKDLDDKTKNLKTFANEAKENKRNLDEAISQVELDRKVIDDMKTSSASDLKEFNQQRDEYVATKQLAENQIKDLQGQIVEITESLNTNKKGLKQSQNKVDQHALDNKRYIATNSEYEIKVTKLEAKIKTIQKKLVDKNNELQSLKDNNAKNVVELEKLEMLKERVQKDITDLQGSLRKSESERKQYIAINLESKNKISRLEAQIELIGSELRQKKVDLQTFANKAKDHVEILKDATIQVESKSQAIKEMKIKTNFERKQFEQQLDELRNTTRVTENQKSKLQEQIVTLQTNVSTFNSTNLQQSKKVSELENKLNENAEMKQQLDKNILEHKQEIEKINRTFKELKSICEKKETEYKIKTSESTQKMARLSKELKVLSEELKTTRDVHENKLKNLTQMYDDKMGICKSEIDKLTNELKQTKNDFDQVSSDANEHSILVEGLKADIKSKEDEIVRLSNRQIRLDSELKNAKLPVEEQIHKTSQQLHDWEPRMERLDAKIRELETTIQEQDNQYFKDVEVIENLKRENKYNDLWVPTIFKLNKMYKELCVETKSSYIYDYEEIQNLPNENKRIRNLDGSTRTLTELEITNLNDNTNLEVDTDTNIVYGYESKRFSMIRGRGKKFQYFGFQDSKLFSLEKYFRAITMCTNQLEGFNSDSCERDEDISLVGCEYVKSKILKLVDTFEKLNDDKLNLDDTFKFLYHRSTKTDRRRMNKKLFELDEDFILNSDITTIANKIVYVLDIKNVVDNDETLSLSKKIQISIGIAAMVAVIVVPLMNEYSRLEEAMNTPSYLS